jgi:hypothetical protein
VGYLATDVMDEIPEARNALFTGGDHLSWPRLDALF